MSKENMDSQRNTNLFKAISHGDIQKVRSLIAEGAEINAHCVLKTFPLHYAIRFFRLEIIEELLKHGAEVHVLNNSNQTPLCIVMDSLWKAASNYKDIGREKKAALLLIEHHQKCKKHLGYNLDNLSAFHPQGQTLLNIACTTYILDEDIITKLLEAGCDPMKKNNDGWTPIASVIAEVPEAYFPLVVSMLKYSRGIKPTDTLSDITQEVINSYAVKMIKPNSMEGSILLPEEFQAVMNGLVGIRSKAALRDSVSIEVSTQKDDDTEAETAGCLDSLLDEQVNSSIATEHALQENTANETSVQPDVTGLLSEEENLLHLGDCNWREILGEEC